MKLLNLNEHELRSEPFKYINSKKIFAEDLYKTLSLEFPVKKDFEIDGVLSNDNRYDYNLEHIFQSNNVSDTWNRVIRELTSFDFFLELCKVFDVDSHHYRNVVYRHNKTESTHEGSVIVDLQFCYNLKNSDKQSSFLRMPHVDSKDKLFVLLLYFPNSSEYRAEDRGELLLYETNEVFDKTYMNYKSMMKNLKVIDKVCYDHNHGIIFLNSNKAVHAPMSLINNSNDHRRFVNVVFIDKFIKS